MKNINLISISIISFFIVLGIACQDQSKTGKKSDIALSEKKKQELTKILNDVYQKDQEYRQLYYSTTEKYGIRSAQMKELSSKMNKADALNLIVVKDIIKKYGWLSDKMVGATGNSALFLVIQHSSEKDQEHFLPMMRKAAQNGAASKQDLAKLEDRVAIDQGHKQTYGTQVGMDEKSGKYYVFPIENPKEVDKRRAALGMIPIAAYLSQWQIEWEN
nr:hypothetical protein [Pseudopedobacter sp.]